MQAYRSDRLIVRYAPILLDASTESERHHLPLNGDAGCDVPIRSRT